MPASLLAVAIIACTAPQVHDGDTLRCGADRVRLFGVDAPEVRRGQTPAQPYAYEARDELVRLTRGRVGCRVVDRDRYGRLVGRCWSDASPDLNAAVIPKPRPARPVAAFGRARRRRPGKLESRGVGKVVRGPPGFWRERLDMPLGSPTRDQD